MHTRSRRTLLVLAAQLGIAVFVVTVSSCASSPDPVASATATPTRSTSSPGVSTAPSTILPPPTEPSAKPSTAPTQKSTNKALTPVDVVTTFAGWNPASRAVEVGGYARVVEPVGTCTLALIRGDQVVIRKHTATPDATTVACGGFSLPRSELAAGGWKAVLSYTSSRSTGEAAAVTIEVP